VDLPSLRESDTNLEKVLRVKVLLLFGFKEMEAVEDGTAEREEGVKSSKKQRKAYLKKSKSVSQSVAEDAVEEEGWLIVSLKLLPDLVNMFLRMERDKK